MCERLSEIDGAMRRFAADFDAALYSGDDAARVVDVAGAIENMAATVKALAAARVAECGAWRSRGDRSPAHYLARRTGTSVGQAAECLATAKRLEAQPEVASAARSGELSAAQASAISAVAAAAPAAAGRLMEAARESSLAELRSVCARTRAAAVPDAEQRRQRIHAGRSLRAWTDAEGVWHLHVRNNPEVGARIMAVVDPVRDRLFRTARAEGRREPSEAYAADALAEVVCGGAEAKPGAAAKVIVRVDLDALLRGYPIEGECCELAGYGPVAVSAVRDLMDSADPFLAAVVTKGQAVVGVAHLGRRPTAAQRTALEWLYPECGVEGCAAVARLEFDHRVDWAATKLTIFDLLDRECRHHHDLKTLDGWAFVPGRGKRAFVAPDDPRHPKNLGG